MRLSKSNKTLITGIVLGALLAAVTGLLVSHVILTAIGLRGPLHEDSVSVEDRSDDVGCVGDARLGQLCTEGEGACRSLGSYFCLSGEVQCSAIAGVPLSESCDGIDNDCDGVIDGISRACYDGPPGTEEVGLCRLGDRQCINGAWAPGSCPDDIVPTTEIPHNGIDEDCDGANDFLPNGTTSAAGEACGIVGEKALTITIDNARLDALFGACPEGRRIGIWDQCGTFLYSALRARSFTVRGMLSDGFYTTVVACGDTLYTWPSASTGQSARSNGFSDIVLDDSQLVEHDALICPEMRTDPGGTSWNYYNRLSVPVHPDLRGQCPGDVDYE